MGPVVEEEEGRQQLPWDGKPCFVYPKSGRLRCRPSFLIIGAGKSGTSSLYYYLQAHPQVKAATQKQIQFFDHQSERGLDWYLGNFPPRMADGHVTGEASPGYIVYSKVPLLVHRLVPQVRLLAVLREPIDRLWSSYHYNYLDVLLAEHAPAQGRKGLFRTGESSFHPAALEAFVQVEIGILETCLAQHKYDPRAGGAWARALGGKGNQTGAKEKGRVDFSADCFSGRPHGVTAGEQFDRIRKAHKALKGKSSAAVSFPRANQHLFRQFVSRGLYSLMLEHWYAAFPAEQLLVMCTEDLSLDAPYHEAASSEAAAGSEGALPSDLPRATAFASEESHAAASEESQGAGPARAMARVGRFLGLEAMDFGPVVAKGKFNAATHRG